MLGRAGEVLSQCEICQASEEAPYLPAAGASSGDRDFRWVLRFRSTPLPFMRWICTPRFPSRRDYARRTPQKCGMLLLACESRFLAAPNPDVCLRGEIHQDPIPEEGRPPVGPGAPDWAEAGNL